MFGEQRTKRTETRTETIEETPMGEPWALQGVSLGDSIRTGLKSTAVALVLVVGVGLVLVAQGHLPAGFWAAGVLVALAVGTLPAALDVIAEHEQAALKRRTARAALRADLLRAETALTTRRYRLVQVEAEQSTRLALVTHREANRAELTTQDDAADLLRFLACVFVRNESPGARRWTGSAARLPSGRTFRAEDWQTKLIQPCLAIGALMAPERNGAPYKPAPGYSFGRTVRALQAAGHLPPAMLQLQAEHDAGTVSTLP